MLAKLEANDVRPNPAVDRRTLIRRAYFDLIGLPPAPEDVERFVGDPAPDAYEQLIERLLQAPQYGERWGRHWLDLVRFAESHGYEQDYDRPTAYHYRDFIIKALNMDLPYDTFVRWQIAGDEFEPEEPLALMATGFLAAGTHATQITANQAEKERYDELDDMIRTIGATMLGLTIGCARCHDHKYDPISATDYYRLVSTFATTVRSDFDINLDPQGYRVAKAQFDEEHEPLLAELDRIERESLPERFDEWLKRSPSLSDLPGWIVLDAVEPKSQSGATFTKLDDGSLLAGGNNPDSDTYTFVAPTQVKGVTSVRLEALAHESLVKQGPGRAENGNFGLSDFRATAAPLDGQSEPVAIRFKNPRATFEQANLPVANAIDDNRDSCWAVDPQFGRDHAAVFETESEIGFDGGTKFTFTLEFKANKKHGIGRPRLSVATTPRPVAIDDAAIPETAYQVIAAQPGSIGELTAEQTAAGLKWYRTLDSDWRRVNERVQEHAKAAPKPALVKALISSEGVPPVRLHTQGLDFYDPTYVLNRGDPNQKGEVATQGFLPVLMRTAEVEKRWQQPPPPTCRTSYRRRALANWITDVDHGAGPLLARVIVNRLWYYHMGRGIVATPSDFGRIGAPPTHPELLDWLATELIRSGWRLKPIHKLIMTSALYMQSNATDESRLAADRDNSLFWHRPGRRLEAEVIRDAMLAVSGLLDTTQFGAGTLDPNHRRRSIYFFIKRSQLVPMMTLFDGPDALQDLPCRVSTTIAPQALMLLNSTAVRDYAAHLARRVRVDRGELRATVRNGYLIALSRPPSDDELAEATGFLVEQAAAYESADKENAADLALIDFCHTLLCLNEFVYVE